MRVLHTELLPFGVTHCGNLSFVMPNARCWSGCLVAGCVDKHGYGAGTRRVAQCGLMRSQEIAAEQSLNGQ